MYFEIIIIISYAFVVRILHLTFRLMQSGLGDAKSDLRRAFVRVESGLTKRCQVLKVSC